MIGERLSAAYNLFSDELSKDIFAAKAEWYFLGGEDKTNDILYKQYDSSRILGLEEYPRGTSFAICGAGNFGRQTLRALRHAGYEVKCFLDNDVNRQGECIEGVKIYSFMDFVSNAELNFGVVVIIDNMRLGTVFFNELFELGFPQQRIYKTSDNIVRTAFGNIYFDLPELEPSQDEVFIDAGSFNGSTTKEFVKWCSGSYKKVYAFEPMQDGYNLAKACLADVENVEVIDAALSDECGEANFAQSFSGLMGSRLGETGDKVETVRIDTIDNILSGEPVTFIKMDIEGAELAALKGAEQTLKQYKPKLAISLYHKNEDLYEIPLWLKEVVPEYKFYLRHYSNKRWDLVLYCVV